MTAKRAGVLDPLRVRVRRFQLIVGLGLIACVLGAVLSIPISIRVLSGLQVGPAVFETIRTVISQLWAWAVLPGLLYAIARIIDLRPWSAAIGGVVTGVVFTSSIVLISRGFEGFTSEHPARLVTLLLTDIAGVFLAREAVKRARAAAHRAEEQARKAAEARKDEYAQFAREAERIAAMNEARASAASGASAASATVGEDGGGPATPSTEASPPSSSAGGSAPQSSTTSAPSAAAVGTTEDEGTSAAPESGAESPDAPRRDRTDPAA